MSNGSSGVFDSNQAFESFFIASERIYLTVQFALWLRFREFWAPATAASSGGGSTSGSSSASSSGASSSSTTDAGPHSHGIANYNAGGPGAFTARRFDGLAMSFNLATDSAANLYTDSDGAGGHDHGMAHTHGIPHTHGIGHDHTVPPHVHGLDFGIYREAMPGSINVDLKLWRKPFVGGAWALVTSVSGLDQVEVYLDLTSWFVDDPSGLWLLTLKSAAGQPNGGRLAVDVVRDAYGAIQSA